MKRKGSEPFGIGSQLLASNVPVEDVITYLGWDICAVSPRDGLGPSLVNLGGLVEPRTYRRTRDLLSRRPDERAGDLGPPTIAPFEAGSTLPKAFCWTRFGTEAGMTIEEILRRKEMERIASGGMFVWGIGNSLGKAIDELRARDPEPNALFSEIAGKAAPHDVWPDAVVAWRSFRDGSGASTTLPRGVLVVSRASNSSGGVKRCYGLFCSTSSPLAIESHAEIEIGSLRNLTGANFVGDSQTTAVVEQDAGGTSRRRYHVSLIARLVEPYYAEMLDPIPVSAAHLARIHESAKTEDVVAWTQIVTEILGES